MKDSPAPPNPYTTADAQTKSNVATGTANQETNMVNQSNPFGSLNYAQNGTNPDGTPKFSASTTLSAPMQGIFDKSTGLANTLLSNGEGALSGKAPDLSYDGTAANLDALNHARLDPQWADNSRHQEDTLAARGITAGTPAYDNAMRVFNQGKNDAYNSANLADYGQAVNSKLAQWGAPLTALGSVFGTAKGTAPQFASTPQTNIPGTNVAGLVEQNYQQQSQNANAQNGQLAGIFGSGLGALGSAFGGNLSGAMGGLFGGGGGGGGQWQGNSSVGGAPLGGY